MKKVFLFIIVSAFLSAVFYLMGAFAETTFDIARRTSDARGAVIFGFIVSLIIGLISVTETD